MTHLDFASRKQNLVSIDDLPDEIRKAIRMVEVIDRVDFTRANEFYPGQILSTDLLVFGPGVSLMIGNSGHAFIVIFANKIILPGGNQQIDIHIPTSAPVNGIEGNRGLKGDDGKYKIEDINGKIGGTGRAGSAGVVGAQPPQFWLITAEIEYLTPPLLALNPLRIISRGVDGGVGGVGGPGGPGGDGFDAIEGSSYFVSDDGTAF